VSGRSPGRAGRTGRPGRPGRPGRSGRSAPGRGHRRLARRPTRAGLTRRFRSLYGAGPLHLLALLASFAIAGAAVVGWFQRPFDVSAVLVWFVAAILAHDLVLLPLYSLLDRIAFARAEGRHPAAPAAPAAPSPRRAPPASPVSAVPYLRVPTILSGLLLLVFFPLIFQLGSGTFSAASGHDPSGYLARWLAATGVLFAASAFAYALAVRRARGRRPDQAMTGSVRQR